MKTTRGATAAEAAAERRQFRAWMLRVDRVLDSICGFGSSDLADICYRDLFDSGESPRFAAFEALRQSDFEVDEVDDSDYDGSEYDDQYDRP